MRSESEIRERLETTERKYDIRKESSVDSLIETELANRIMMLKWVLEEQ